MGKSQRQKGVRGELLWRDECRKHGYAAERGCQLYQRGSEIADVVGLPFIHIECKNVEKLNVRAAMKQSIEDAEKAGRGELPIVAHKMNRRPWLVTLLSDDFFRLYAAWERGQDNEQGNPEQGPGIDW